MTTRGEAWAEVRACTQALEELEARIWDALNAAEYGVEFDECVNFEHAAAALVTLLNYLGDDRGYPADVLAAPAEPRGIERTALGEYVAKVSTEAEATRKRLLREMGIDP